MTTIPDKLPKVPDPNAYYKNTFTLTVISPGTAITKEEIHECLSIADCAVIVSSNIICEQITDEEADRLYAQDPNHR